MKKSTFAERLAEALEYRRMSQTELADLTNTSKSSISAYLAGEYEAKQRRVDLFSQVLNVSPIWLMGFDVPMQRHLEDRSTDFNYEHDQYDAQNNRDIPDIQQRLQELMSQISPDAGLAFLNGDEPMDDETKELMYESLKNALRLSKLLAERNKEK